MAVTLPGTTIQVDHYKDSTWREEFFLEEGTDYTCKIYRERLGYADAAETQLLTQNKDTIPTSLIGGNIDPGKPAWVEFKLSNLIIFGQNINQINAAALQANPNFDSTHILLSDIPTLIIIANEIVMQIAGQHRTLRYQLDNELITLEQFDTASALLMPMNMA